MYSYENVEVEQFQTVCMDLAFFIYVCYDGDYVNDEKKAINYQKAPSA